MTHTLHPEIEENIQKIIMDIYSDILPGLEKHNVTLTKEDFDFIRNSIREHLCPYLLPPSQHLKDEPSNDDIVQIGISGGYQIYAKRGFARKAAQSIRGYGNDKYIPEPLENEPAPKRFIVRIKETNKFMASCMTEAAARHYVKTSPISEHLEITEEPKDNEPLPEKEIDDKTKLGIYDTTQNIMQDIRTYVYEYDEVQKMRLLALLDKHLLKFGGQEQSTPKIEKINIAYMEGCGEQTVWEEPIIVKKINEIILWINNHEECGGR